MAEHPNYADLDDPQLLQFIFFPRKDWAAPPAGAFDHQIPVEGDVSLSARFYPLTQSAPLILYFHGNGEVASDYDWIAPLYHQIGVSLVVTDYRGYGKSGGHPTFSNSVADAHSVLRYVLNKIVANKLERRVFVMGRSLGSQPAIELAASYPNEIGGLILESGFARHGLLLRRLGLPVVVSGIDDFEAKVLKRIRAINMPALIIHGELDMLIPYTEAIAIYNAIGSTQKELVIIRSGDHNTLMTAGIEEYFSAIQRFIFGTKTST